MRGLGASPFGNGGARAPLDAPLIHRGPNPTLKGPPRAASTAQRRARRRCYPSSARTAPIGSSSRGGVSGRSGGIARRSPRSRYHRCMTLKEKILFHQVHPAKLATDIIAAIVSLYFF